MQFIKNTVFKSSFNKNMKKLTDYIPIMIQNYSNNTNDTFLDFYTNQSEIFWLFLKFLLFF
jgi:hypothetical protein